MVQSQPRHPISKEQLGMENTPITLAIPDVEDQCPRLAQAKVQDCI
jgi:hypothetical protein